MVLKLRELLHPPRTAFLFGITIFIAGLLLSLALSEQYFQYRLLSTEGVRTTARVVRSLDPISQRARSTYEFNDEKGNTIVIPGGGEILSTVSSRPVLYVRSNPSIYRIGEQSLYGGLIAGAIVCCLVCLIGTGICLYAIVTAIKG